jgi:hypothetical protein
MFDILLFFNVPLPGIEPRARVPQTLVLSIKLQRHVSASKDF